MNIHQIIRDGVITDNGTHKILTIKYVHYEIKDVTIYGKWIFKPVVRHQHFLGITRKECEQFAKGYLQDIRDHMHMPVRRGTNHMMKPRRNIAGNFKKE